MVMPGSQNILTVSCQLNKQIVFASIASGPIILLSWLVRIDFNCKIFVFGGSNILFFSICGSLQCLQAVTRTGISVGYSDLSQKVDLASDFSVFYICFYIRQLLTSNMVVELKFKLMQIMEKQTDQLLDHLRSKVQSLQKTELQSQRKCSDLKNELQKIEAAHAMLLTQIDVQKNKYLALNVFVAELQRKYDTQFTDLKAMGSGNQALSIQKAFLKQLLIKKGEEAEQYRKVNLLMKSMSEGRGKSLAQTQMIEQQSQTLAKLSRKLAEFRNEDLLCTRKWTNLQKQNIQLENRFRSLKLQQQRQSVTTQELYEQYLDKVNKNNTRLAYLQGTLDEKIISEHLIEQVSLVQQQRRDSEAERNELKDQLALMQREFETIKKQNQTLKQFFSDRTEQSRLTNRMRLRVEELSDLLTDYKKGVSEPRLLALSKTVDSVKQHLQKLKEANKYLEQRLEESMKGNACIDDVVAGKFFSNLLAEKDQQIKYEKKICDQMKQKISEIKFQKESIKIDIDKMKSQMEPQTLQHRVNTRSLQRQILNEFTFKEQDK